MGGSIAAHESSSTEARKIRIKAREFLMVFRDKSDDDYLMRRFSLKTTELQKIYDQLLDRGLLSEYEYAHRESKSSEIETDLPSSANVSAPSTVVEVVETCPKCNRPRHPDYEDSCPHCGIVFAKVKRPDKPNNVTYYGCSDFLNMDRIKTLMNVFGLH